MELKKGNPHDPVNNPKHYTSHPSGVECLEIVQELSFCAGNAFKYLFRYQLKNGVEDLKKAEFYLKRLLSDPKAARCPALSEHAKNCGNKVIDHTEDDRVTAIFSFLLVADPSAVVFYQTMGAGCLKLIESLIEEEEDKRLVVMAAGAKI